MPRPIDPAYMLENLRRAPTPPWRPVPSRLLAIRMGIGVQALANWRIRDNGPPYEPHLRGQGNRTFYRPDTVLEWLSVRVSEHCPAWTFVWEWLEQHAIVPVGEPSPEGAAWMANELETLIPADQGARRTRFKRKLAAGEAGV